MNPGRIDLIAGYQVAQVSVPAAVVVPARESPVVRALLGQTGCLMTCVLQHDRVLMLAVSHGLPSKLR